MFRKTNGIIGLAAVAVLALAIPATSSATVDVRNPDSKAAAIAAQNQSVDLRNPDSRTPAPEPRRSPYVDLRSPDSKDVGQPAASPSYVDLRSPDSKDVGQPAASSTPAPEIVQASDFDWGAAAIGAGSVLGLLLVGLSAMFLVTHRRSHGATT